MRLKQYTLKTVEYSNDTLYHIFLEVSVAEGIRWYAHVELYLEYKLYIVSIIRIWEYQMMNTIYEVDLYSVIVSLFNKYPPNDNFSGIFYRVRMTTCLLSETPYYY